MHSRLIHIPNLARDEQIEGLIAGTCSVYGISRRHFLANGLGIAEALDSKLDYDLDDTDDRNRLLKAIGATNAHPLLQGQVMKTARRGQFCPLCLRADRAAGDLPRFRLAWAQIFRTHCPLHRSPLLPWRYTDKSHNARMFPADILDSYLGRPPQLKKGRLQTTPDDFGITVAEKVTIGLHERDIRYFGYQQQLHWEDILLQEQDPLCYPFQMSPSELRRVVTDLSTLIMSSFDSVNSMPAAIRLAWSFGPSWLFSPFKSNRSQLGQQQIVMLDEVEDPGVRRSVLSSVMRMLLSLTSEVDYSHSDGSIIGCARPTSVKVLTDLPVAAKQWIAQRALLWPTSMQTLYRHVVPDIR